MIERVDLDDVFRFRDRGADRARANLHEIGAARQHRLFGEPGDRRLELVGEPRGVRRRADHVAAADVDLVGERQCDRFARDGFRLVAIEADDACDR